MATTTTPDLASSDAHHDASSTRSLLWARTASLVSILPLGIWTVNHLWDNLAVWTSGAAWQAAVTKYDHPFAHGATMLMVLLPLGLHAVWGVQRLLSGRPNNVRYGYFDNLKYLVQRIAGLGALGFLGAHIWLAMLQPRLMTGQAEPFEAIAREMRFHAPTLIVYLLGTAGVTFHLANGLSSFAWQWGLISGKSSLKRFDWVTLPLFLVLTGMAWGAIYGIWLAGDALGPAAH